MTKDQYARVLVVGDSIHADLVRQRAKASGVLEANPSESMDPFVLEPFVLWIAEELHQFSPEYEPPPEFYWYPHAEVIMQTPVPIGTCDRLARQTVPPRTITYFLENVRKGDIDADFPRSPIVIGHTDTHPTPLTDQALRQMFPTELLRTAVTMTAVQAEIAKHAINFLLATLAGYSEELKAIGEARGLTIADVAHVARAVRRDPRFGGALPILPKGRYSAHLERDVLGLHAENPSGFIAAVMGHSEDRP